MRAGLRTIPRIVAGLAALALLLGGCEAANRAAEGGGASEAGGRAVLEYGWAAGDLTTLDPHLASASQDRTLVDMVFGGLLRYEPGTDDVIEPDIARAVPRPEERGGKQVWRFDIRPGVMCHQGTDTEAYELTSDDVLYSLKRAADPNFSAFASTYAGMTFRKAGAQSVEVVLDQSLPPELFLPAFTDYAGGFIVCKKALEAMGDKSFATHPVGTGPFMFSNYTSQDRVELVAFDDYWRGEPELGGVTLRYMPDDTSRQLALERGDVHLISGVSDDRWVESIRSQDGPLVDIFGPGEATFVEFDITVEPLDDPRVREAIAYALDPDDIRAAFGDLVTDEIYSLAPAQLSDGGLTKEEAQSEGVLYAQDLERTEGLLADAGQADGFSMELVTSELEDYRRVYEVMQSQLSEVGIDLSLDVVDHPTMHELIRKGSNPITVYVAYRQTAHEYLFQFAHSSARIEVGETPVTNFAKYSDRRVDDLIDTAQGTADTAERAQLWKEANTKLLADAVVYPLFLTYNVYARTPQLDYGYDLEAGVDTAPRIDETTTLES